MKHKKKLKMIETLFLLLLYLKGYSISIPEYYLHENIYNGIYRSTVSMALTYEVRESKTIPATDRGGL
jgi:hypothetical protein